MKFLAFVRHRLLGISDKDLDDWTDSDFAHYAILCACIFIAAVVGAGAAVFVDRPVLLIVAAICATVMVFQFVFSILAWRIQRAKHRRPPPRP